MEKTKEKSREEYFVDSIIRICGSNTGMAARLRRADNPSMEYQSWEVLASLGVNLENDYMRLPYSLIAAVVAKSKVANNGSISLGQAIALCYEDGNGSDQAKARLRRILACNDVVEVCRVLRSFFSLIESRVKKPLNYSLILRQIRNFYFDPSRTKARWAQDFYARPLNDDIVL